jgi:hypothetical protein
MAVNLRQLYTGLDNIILPHADNAEERYLSAKISQEQKQKLIEARDILIELDEQEIQTEEE